MVRILTLISCIAMAGAAGAQPPQPGQRLPPEPASAAAQPPAGQTAQGGALAEKPPAGAGYTYDPQGRRDPFVSLLQRGADPRANTANRPPGLPGVLISEVTVKGILKDPSGFIAMIEAPDKKTYIVRSGQKLLDGSVKSITVDSVVFSQDVTDPLSLVKQREVRKGVRSSDRG
jgi:Tfp pilus assembly protein PilP